MKRNILTLMAGALLLGMSSMSAMAAGKTIAVSWKTFQEERWKTDEAAIKAVVEAAGNTYVSTDAQGSAQKQAADIEGLISQKPDDLVQRYVYFPSPLGSRAGQLICQESAKQRQKADVDRRE